MVTFGKKCFQFTLHRLGLCIFSLYFVLQFQVHTKKTWREPAETSNAWLMSSIARLVRYGGRWKRNISKISWSRYAKRENKERNGVTTANKWTPAREQPWEPWSRRLNLASPSLSLQIIKLESKTNEDPGTSWSYYKEQGLKLNII